MNLAPIVLFVYKRLWHTRQTVEALQKNELAQESELFIFSDGPKPGDEEKVKEVREYIRNIKGFKRITIIERDKNWGLANNIIDGVTRVVNEYGKIIVLEDDLVTSPYFLRFMNEALEMYKDEPKVASIHGYIYPIEGLPETFFIRGADCWGWATWRDKWAIFEPDAKKLLEEVKRRNLQREADFNGDYSFTKILEDYIKGKNNSWAVRWYFSAFLKDMLTLYPGKSYVRNIGFGKDSTHTKSMTEFLDIKELNQRVNIKKIPVEEDKEARKKIENFLKKNKPSIVKKIYWKIKSIIEDKRRD
jgi:hypothetical protein